MNDRECDCPAWFLRCAHLDEKLIFLGDRLLVTWVNGIPSSVKDDRFRVWSLSYGAPIALYKGNCYGTALDVFYAAEEALLRGDAPTVLA